MLDKNIVLAEEISETHQKLREKIVKETFRDYYGVQYMTQEEIYNLREIVLVESFFEKRYNLIDNIVTDFYQSNKYYGYYGIERTPKGFPVVPQDCLTPNSPAMRLAWQIKEQSTYYLTRYEEFALKAIIKANLINMSSLTIDIFNAIIKYKHCNMRPIEFQSDMQYEKMIAEVNVIQDFLGTQKLLRFVFFNIREQYAIYTDLQNINIPIEKITEFFLSENYRGLITNLKNIIFNNNTPF